MIDAHGEPAEIKQCCTAFYGSDLARFLWGESFHPGGIELTVEVAGMLRLAASARVLDLASGRGTSAFAVAERFGCRVVGVDLSEANVAGARAVAAARGLSDRVTFVVADAEGLPFPAESFDAVLCECAFCTFPDKGRAAGEIARVLRAGGRLGLSDLTRVAGPLPELDGLLAWVACIADAQPLEGYLDRLSAAGLVIRATVSRDDCLATMVEGVRGKLMVADILTGLKKLAITGLELAQAKAFARAAAQAVAAKRLGYAVIVAERPAA